MGSVKAPLLKDIIMNSFKVGDVVYIHSERNIDASKRTYMTVTGFNKL